MTPPHSSEAVFSRARANPPPFPVGAGLVLFEVACVAYLVVSEQPVPEGFAEWLPPLLVLSGLLGLLALGVVGRWVYRLGRSVRAPSEPWLWDHPWSSALPDRQWVHLWEAWSIALFLLLLPLVFHVLIYRDNFSQGRVGRGVLSTVILLLVDAAIVYWVARPALRKTQALLRFGRMHLRLPQVPLSLGARYQLDLMARPTLVSLREVKVELRRVRAWRVSSGHGNKKSTRMVTEVEFRQEQTVDAAPLRSGRDLPLDVEFPTSSAEDSTVLHGARRCYWELQLTSDVPGVNLDTTFVLPVYDTGGTPDSLES